MYPNLMAEMARQKITQSRLAEMLGISERTMSDKLRGCADFKLSEMMKIKDQFGQTLDYLFERAEPVAV